MPPKKSIINSLIESREGFDIEFKRIANAVESEDLVAFANSPEGGYIIIGVAEVKNENNGETMNIKGAKVGDHERLIILNKAQDCLPPVELFLQNYKFQGKDLLVIEIPTGSNRPYCTKKGVYKIRGEGRNQVLTQELLFQIIMEKEYQTFLERFKTATHELKDEMLYMQDIIEKSEGEISNSLQGIFAEATEAEATSQDVFSMTEGISDMLGRLGEEFFFHDDRMNDLEEKVDLILKHLNIEKPEVTRMKFFISREIKAILTANRKSKIKQRKSTIIKKILMGPLKERYELDEVEISSLYDQLTK